ncbi:MAG: VWA domain-containing protein [Gammaproteobacteria bacterium]|nr:VWA domain-containing protein [Gammaproteobacteria bacterium]
MNKLPSSESAINQFLAKAASIRPPIQGATQRLIFAMDATASRSPTWDLACSLHAELFSAVRDVGNILVQLAYFRGLDEFWASPWKSTPDALLNTMLGVRCLGGRTQVLRVVEHARRECATHPIRALVLVGDCFEENPTEAVAAAGQLAVHGVPMFIFQEGNGRDAAQVFAKLARITRGAHIPFRPGSAQELRELLRAVAAYAAQGRSGLETALNNPMAHKLLTQIDR